MILKSFELDKTNFSKFKLFVLYGENEGLKKEIIVDSSRIRPSKSEVDSLWGDNKKILASTNWDPIYKGMDGFILGLEKTFNWYKHLKLNEYSTNYVT